MTSLSLWKPHISRWMNKAQTASEASSRSVCRSVPELVSGDQEASLASAASVLRPWRPNASARAEASSYSRGLNPGLDGPEIDRGGLRLTIASFPRTFSSPCTVSCDTAVVRDSYQYAQSVWHVSLFPPCVNVASLPLI